jgi:trehalose 6-phosphate synthase complex regulatory subunit
LVGCRKDPEVIEWVEVLYQRYSGMKLVVGRDKMDEIQGVKYKLLAFEMFLERRPEWRGKVCSPFLAYLLYILHI